MNPFYHSLIANRDSRPLKYSKNYSNRINFCSKNSNSDFHEFWPLSNEKIHFLYFNLKLTTSSRFFNTQETLGHKIQKFFFVHTRLNFGQFSVLKNRDSAFFSI